MNAYSDSNYAYERVGFDLCCESSYADLENGDCTECVHCGDEYEHADGNPNPCKERIAQALEDLRALTGKP